MTEEISSVDARIVDLPIRRPHRIGAMEMRGQSCVVIRVRTADGLTGLGEGMVPGGGGKRLGKPVHELLGGLMGGRSPQAEVERIVGVLEKLPEGLTYVVDANGKWDEPSARRWLPVLAGAGIGIAEQLVPAWNLEAMSRLTGATRTWVMADESVRTLSEALAVARLHAAEYSSSVR